MMARLKRVSGALGPISLPLLLFSCSASDEEIGQLERQILFRNISAQNYADSTAQQQEWATSIGILTFRWRLNYLGAACPNPATGTSFDCSVDLDTYSAQEIVNAGFDPLCAHGTNSHIYPSELVVDPACSAFLIGPDTFATAGHCIYPDGEASGEIDELFECSNMSIVLRWRQADDGSSPNGNTRVLERHVYHCEEVLSHGRSINGWTLPPGRINRNSDWAIFRVDRTVTGGQGTGGPLTPEREAFPLATSLPTAGEGGFTSIGHPYGHPTKIDPELVIEAVPFADQQGTFTFEGDVAGGVSGGPVIDASGNVVGVISGAPGLLKELDPRWPTSSTVRTTCGNDVIDGSEECDDGNTESGDGCSDNCEEEQFCNMECYPANGPDPVEKQCKYLTDFHPVAVSTVCVGRKLAGASSCTAQCPCQEGGGDCDSDADCQSGLTCARDYGPAFRQASTYDICVEAGCEDRTLGSGSFCSDNCPCGYGGGDCDPGSDTTPKAECLVGLVCVKDYGAHFGASEATDVCVTKKCADRTAGDGSFCTEECPCGQGGGDCDRAADCMPGLVCASDVGPAFGKSSTHDHCVSSTCTQQTGNNLGAGNFCSAACPCGEGGGDCDANSECMRGLSCATDYGAHFGAGPKTDICVPSACAGRAVGSGSFCTEGCPCGQGGGDCDGDSDCMPGLVCASNVGPAFGQSGTHDHCVPAACTQQTGGNLGAGDFCSAACPCGEGGGDCDSDSECTQGLTCTHNVGAQFGYSSATDVCLP